MRLCTCETAYVIHFPASHRARASASRASLGRENCAPMCAGLVHICPGDKAAHMSVHILDTEQGRDKDMYAIGTFGRYAAGAAGVYATGESAVMRLEGTTSNTSWWSPRAALGVHRLGVPLWAPLASCKRVEHFKQICNLDNVEQWFGNRWATYPR